jgi:hypothetical protein
MTWAFLALLKRLVYTWWYGEGATGSDSTATASDDAAGSTGSPSAQEEADLAAASPMGIFASKESKEVSHIIREFITDELKYDLLLLCLPLTRLGWTSSASDRSSDVPHRTVTRVLTE